MTMRFTYDVRTLDRRATDRPGREMSAVDLGALERATMAAVEHAVNAPATSFEERLDELEPVLPPRHLALRIAAGLSALALVAVTAATFFAVRS